jgi:exopolyphosphatase/guanosine-5'-triphosphate,3'-diphosphate pyrophosphatase
VSSASPAPVAVIDLGSNSIKLLVAVRNERGEVAPLHSRTIDARIGAGMNRTEPVLSDAGMSAALDAVKALLAEARPQRCREVVLVATSAVRDARNGPDFASRLRSATGLNLRILSGTEEANLIGRGLTVDPALAKEQNFYVFDLGGGSLECLAFRKRQIIQAVSLQLGCVRLTERFVPDAHAPFPRQRQPEIERYITDRVHAAGFNFPLLRSAAAIGTGGTVTTARSVLAARDGKTFAESAPEISVARLQELYEQLVPLTYTERCAIAGLPPTRADVFPVALLTLITLAGLGGFSSYRNSLYNLRYGLAAELLV